jgi:hypothetical protein
MSHGSVFGGEIADFSAIFPAGLKTLSGQIIDYQQFAL